jgi:aspartate carbamoyltransferase catalytic subunit
VNPHLLSAADLTHDDALLVLDTAEEMSRVADSARSTIVEQVTNGVSVRMAVLYLLLSGATEGEATP